MAYTPYQYQPYGDYTPYPMPQNYPQQPAQAPQQPQTPQGGGNGQPGYLCRPVTSKQEAELFPIPFDGSASYFVDTSNGNLYSKAFDFNTGKAPVVTYVRETPLPAVQYATVEQLSAVLEEIERLKKPMGKKAVKNDEPNE